MNRIDYKRIIGTLMLITLVIVGVWALGKVSNATIAVVNRVTGANISVDAVVPGVTPLTEDPQYQMPTDDPNRLDILVMGMRGKDDVQNGGMLTDTIMLFSLDKTTGKVALTSIPRDLTVRITNSKTEKINTAYIYYGLDVKKLFSRVLGVYIDNVVVVDFQAFKEVVDTLGGITITLDKPFKETEQWAGTASDSYVFSLPAGVNNLTGDQALYYVRSRYSSSDFDRSRRQMQVITAIKQKAAALNLTQDPLKALQVVLAVRKHIDTDLNIFDLGTIKDLATQQGLLDNAKRYQLTTDNVLYETMASGTYELLPRGGTLDHLKEFIRTVLTDHPVIFTPVPSPSTKPSV
jgi:LCP family protein required for cell wall assembly